MYRFLMLPLQIIEIQITLITNTQVNLTRSIDMIIGFLQDSSSLCLENVQFEI